MFESDVISDGTQTQAFNHLYRSQFESDVISDGTQTYKLSSAQSHCVWEWCNFWWYSNLTLALCGLSQFESDVISDGTQTNSNVFQQISRFESDVISDGTQTVISFIQTAA